LFVHVLPKKTVMFWFQNDRCQPKKIKKEKNGCTDLVDVHPTSGCMTVCLLILCQAQTQQQQLPV
jgi:hypothetical protein